MAFLLALLFSFLGRSPASQEDPAATATQSKPQAYPPLGELSGKTLVFDAEGGLLRSSSTFPYFMLVALEGGGYLRGLLLLLLYPLLCFLSQDIALRVMVLVCFFGLKVKGFRVGSAVLPKFFLEDVGLEGFEVLRRGGKRVCISCMPRVMVEGFLKDYLEVEVVLGRELKVFGGCYTGLMEEVGFVNDGVSLKSFLGGEEKLGDDVIGIAIKSNKSLWNPLFRLCQEVYLVDEPNKRRWQVLPREKYPKPLIFHDGRLSFRPTPMNTLSMFMWLPIGFPLAILRLIIGLTLPYKASTPILALTGMTWRLKGNNPSTSTGLTKKGHLYACNHRTLIDAIYIEIALNKPVSAVTYSLSRVSELLSPIRTMRLTRDREEDRQRMGKLLSQGDVVVSPEGTTCREPYLLRFSPLFVELSDDIIPVAVDVKVSMFYATTAGGMKCLDPLYYLMNPWMCYELEFLDKLEPGGLESSIDVANRAQEVIGRALGFQCTKLTRKDKYLLLAGNNGYVRAGDI